MDSATMRVSSAGKHENYLNVGVRSIYICKPSDAIDLGIGTVQAMYWTGTLAVTVLLGLAASCFTKK
jgi:hypothetical protein